MGGDIAVCFPNNLSCKLYTIIKFNFVISRLAVITFSKETHCVCVFCIWLMQVGDANAMVTGQETKSVRSLSRETRNWSSSGWCVSLSVLYKCVTLS